MGSKTGENPDDILKHNHQMLAAVHSGRSELRVDAIFLFGKIQQLFFQLLFIFFVLFLM